jgi:lipoprotein NlpD
LASPAAGNSASTHRVGRGDTLYKIAFQYNLDVRNLARANSLSPPYTIFVGQILNLEVSRIAGGQSSLVSTLGTPVDNNSVARSQAGISRSSGVQRRPIGDSGSEPRWQWPHRGRLLRGFQSDVNEGIDIGGLRGDPVLAAGAGEVVYAGSDIQGSGDLIIIRHSDSYLSAYAHNSVMLVNEGSQVSAGQQIAELGENPSGITMLHFEIRQNGKSVDPAIFLPAR